MIFSKRGGFYQVLRVTGPRHNFLAVELATGPQEAYPQVGSRPGFCSGHGELDPAAIVSAVLEGLALANGTFNTSYEATSIEYHVGDNPPEEVYGVLAFQIVERLVSGGFLVEESKDG